MKNSNSNLIVAIMFLLNACVLVGCGGTKVLKDAEPLAVTESIAVASDQRLSATLDWVIFRETALAHGQKTSTGTSI